MDGILSELLRSGHICRLASHSAVDRYFGFPHTQAAHVRTDADLGTLARLFDGLRFPGADFADAAVDVPAGSTASVAASAAASAAAAESAATAAVPVGAASAAIGPRGSAAVPAPPSAAANPQGGIRSTVYFRIIDPDEPREPSYSLLSLTWDARRRVYIDPLDTYPLLRKLREYKKGLESADAAPWWEGLSRNADFYSAALDGAIIVSRYSPPRDACESFVPLRTVVRSLSALDRGLPPSVEAQRTALMGMLSSERPDLGLTLLKESGFLESLWPELAQMDDVSHAKEFHPEGNLWVHTLETFRYRKKEDPILSLGLLLHDLGKPLSESMGGRRFDKHAELGAEAARKFLDRLGFSPKTQSDVVYLVKNHMMPAALPRLPTSRVQEALESPLFSTLLELYRCDESSSFKGLEGYYESSAAYQTYLRNRRNPYRSADGKKINSNRR